MALGNTRVLDDGSFSIGASHLCSPDGQEWFQLGGVPIDEPARVETLDRIDPDDGSRTELVGHQRRYEAPGPANYNYLQMLLSNPVLTDGGDPCVIVHNVLHGTAELYRHDGHGWISMSLDLDRSHASSGDRVHPQSSLSRDREGNVHILLMLESTEQVEWGPDGTSLYRMVLGKGGEILEAGLVAPPEPERAHWLPAIQQFSFNYPHDTPAFLYTVGRNAGGFGQNRNDVETEVWLGLPLTMGVTGQARRVFRQRKARANRPCR